MRQRRSQFDRRVQLPTHGQLRGIVTVVQEDRFRVEDEVGRGYLLTLGRHAGASLRDLHRWSGDHTPVEIEYDGAPDLGAVAVRIRKR